LNLNPKVGGCAAYDFWESRVERAKFFLSNFLTMAKFVEPPYSLNWRKK